MRESKKKVASIVLGAVSVIAERNAQSACVGLLYEPEVPAMLKRNDAAETKTM